MECRLLILKDNPPMSEPRVSIVILNWNSYEVTLDCLLSLRKMDYRKLKLMAGAANHRADLLVGGVRSGSSGFTSIACRFN